MSLVGVDICWVASWRLKGKRTHKSDVERIRGKIVDSQSSVVWDLVAPEVMVGMKGKIRLTHQAGCGHWVDRYNALQR